MWPHIDGLVQERQNSIANALELCLSCTKSSIWRQWNGSSLVQIMARHTKQAPNHYLNHMLTCCQARGSVNDTSNSGRREWKHILGHKNCIQSLPRAKQWDLNNNAMICYPRLKMSSAKWWPCCSGPIVMTNLLNGHDGGGSKDADFLKIYLILFCNAGVSEVFQLNLFLWTQF